jgi:SAM-dependent methyltransferase
VLRSLQRGASTATPANVSYRLSKVGREVHIAGEWLDCGCAEGTYAAGLVARGAKRVVGIDIEEGRIGTAREMFAEREELEFLCARSEALPFADRSFEGVFMNEVLEHVEDESETLSEAWRVLREPGYLAVMSPNRLFPFEGHGLRFGNRLRLDFPVPLVPWLPKIATDRLVEARNYWPWELRALVARHGFTVVHSSSIFPVFETYRWLPKRIIAIHRRNIDRLDMLPLLRHFGVSTLILARKDAVALSD